MKAINTLTATLIIIVVVFIYGCSNSRTITNDHAIDSTAIKNIIDSQSFVFIPRYVNPIGFRRRDLGPGYEISISKDSIISYLPFFGRGYTAPISPSDVDFDFTSTSFTYKVTPARRGWNISIKPIGQGYMQELYFRIYDNAAASLTITSINRSGISYDGYISRRIYQGKKKK